jgi:hypothetical protein
LPARQHLFTEIHRRMLEAKAKAEAEAKGVPFKKQKKQTNERGSMARLWR